MKPRIEVFAVSIPNGNEAHERARQLNQNPPKGWVAGKFVAKSGRAVHTRKQTWSVVGERAHGR